MNANWFPLPKFEKVSKGLCSRSIFTKIDVFSNYWQSSLRKYCKEKKKFVNFCGTFISQAIMFGLLNEASTFQRILNELKIMLEFVKFYCE